MTRTRQTYLGVLVALTLVSSACAGGSTGDVNANYVSLPPAAESVETEFSSDGTVRVNPNVASDQASDDTPTAVLVDQSSDLGEWTQEEVGQAVEFFLFLRDEIVIGNEHPAALEPRASAAVVAAVADQRALNLDGVENFASSARSDLRTFPFVLETSREGDRIAAVVCSEQWGLNMNDAWHTVFVDEAIVFEIVDDELVVAEHHVAHDGARTTEGLTCLSGIFGERAVDGARRGIETMDAIEADPSLALTTDYSEAFDGLAFASIESLGQTIDMTKRRISPVETRYTPIGLDPSKGWDFIAAVSVCRHYPEGVYDEVIATGQRIQVDPDAGPGYSAETIVHVYIEDKPRSEGGTEYLWDFNTNVTEGCW